jgi:hypothetical protein
MTNVLIPEMLGERHLELVLLGMIALTREIDLEGSADDGFIDNADKPRVTKTSSEARQSTLAALSGSWQTNS